MWFRSLLDCVVQSSNHRAQRALQRRRQARRLLFEPLDARRVLAFSPFSELPGGGQPVLQIAGDFTGEGQQDLVVINSSGLQLFRGNGDGTFQAPTTIGTTSASSLLAGDLDADGNLDLVTNREIRLGNGDGTFQSPTAIDLPPQIPAGYHSPVAQQPNSVAVGDLNGDGKLDVTVTGRSSISVYTGSGYYGPYYNHYTSGYANVLLGNGDGTVTHSSLTDFPQQQAGESLALADLNNDSQLDLVAGSYSLVYRFLGNGDGSLQAPVGYGTGGYATSPALLGDFDEDGNIDVLTRDSRFWLTRGKGDGGFFEPSPFSPDQSSDYPQSVAVGDINGDGHMDIAYTTQRVEVTEYELRYGYYGGSYYVPIAGIVHDSAKVILGKGNGTFSAPITSALGSHDGLSGSLYSSRLTDFDGDGLLDLIAADSVLNLMTVALNDGTWAPPPSLSIQDVSIVEGNNGTTNAVFTVTLDGMPSGIVSVDFTTHTIGDASGADYATTAGTLTFGPGVTTRTITVPIVGDALDEYDETFGVRLATAVNAVLLDTNAVGTITDDDKAPSISIADLSKAEGNSGEKAFYFTATLSAPSGKWVSFQYGTADGTASVAAGDYYEYGGTLYFAPGETTHAFVETYVRGDRTKEPNETFFVNILSAQEATIADGQAIGTITNDDGGGRPAKPPKVRIGDASVKEGADGTKLLVFTVSLSEASGELVQVSFATKDYKAKASDNDYVPTSGLLEFSPGQTKKTITVVINGDRKKENDESFFVQLSNAAGAEIADPRGRGHILNDDRR